MTFRRTWYTWQITLSGETYPWQRALSQSCMYLADEITLSREALSRTCSTWQIDMSRTWSTWQMTQSWIYLTYITGKNLIYLTDDIVKSYLYLADDTVKNLRYLADAETYPGQRALSQSCIYLAEEITLSKVTLRTGSTWQIALSRIPDGWHYQELLIPGRWHCQELLIPGRWHCQEPSPCEGGSPPASWRWRTPAGWRNLSPRTPKKIKIQAFAKSTCYIKAFRWKIYKIIFFAQDISKIHVKTSWSLFLNQKYMQ